NFAAERVSSTGTNTWVRSPSEPACSPKVTSYSATSSAVRMKSTRPTLVYVPGVGWEWPCSSAVVTCEVMPEASLHQVNDGENDDPDHVHEVPVQRRHLEIDRVLGRQLLPERQHEHRDQPDHPDGDVGAVESGQGEKARPEDVALEGEPLVDEMSELVHLHRDEEHAAHDGGAEPPQQHL